MLIAGFGFATMGAFVKQGAQFFSPAELVFYRSIVGLISISIVVWVQKKSLKTPVLGKQLARAIIGFVALILFFYAISQLPLATAITLNYTSPMFLALLIPWCLKQEHMRQRKQQRYLILYMLIGFVGVILLIQPVWTIASWPALCIGVLSGLGAAFAYIHVKQLGNLGEPDWRTVFYFTAVCSLGSGLWMLQGHCSPLTWTQLPLLLGLGVSATLSQLAMTRAYRTGHTLTVATLAYSTVIFATLIGVVIWHEHLSTIELAGMLFIMISGVISTRATATHS